ANQTVHSDAAAVQQCGTHPDERAIADARRVNDHPMSHRAIRADDDWLSGIRVKDREILHIGILADCYPFIVAAQNRTPPNARAPEKSYPAHEHSSWRDPVFALGRKFGFGVVKSKNRHAMSVEGLQRHCDSAFTNWRAFADNGFQVILRK